MPITFSINHKDGYFISRYDGKISDEEMFQAYKQFFQGKEWTPGLNELVNLVDADLSEITSNGLKLLAIYADQVYIKYNIDSVKTSVYAPKDFPYGLVRMYSIMIDESPETICVFRDLRAAEAWLKEE